MYSPKIRPDLIPKLWRLAKARRISMTTLVDGFLEEALIGESIPEVKEEENQSLRKQGVRRKEIRSQTHRNKPEVNHDPL